MPTEYRSRGNAIEKIGPHEGGLSGRGTVIAFCSDMSEMTRRVAIAISVKVTNHASLEDIARAAIEAMHRPTDAMIQAAIGSGFEGNERHIIKDWRAMIDEALR